MLPIELQTPGEIARSVAGRVKALRLQRKWTQEELAGRAGLTLATYRRFERTGRIALERLLRIAVILDARAGFDQLFALPPAQSLAELAERTRQPARQRGRRSRADA
ncbi:MAG TPA: helix-turn-helix transcriptional regulator [Longimicrobium sp.]|jgi:transcriptional regulator with XRE-family HTH domain